MSELLTLSPDDDAKVRTLAERCGKKGKQVEEVLSRIIDEGLPVVEKQLEEAGPPPTEVILESDPID